jgi:hypothetical protein
MAFYSEWDAGILVGFVVVVVALLLLLRRVVMRYDKHIVDQAVLPTTVPSNTQLQLVHGQNDGL